MGALPCCPCWWEVPPAEEAFLLAEWHTWRHLEASVAPDSIEFFLVAYSLIDYALLCPEAGFNRWMSVLSHEAVSHPLHSSLRFFQVHGQPISNIFFRCSALDMISAATFKYMPACPLSGHGGMSYSNDSAGTGAAGITWAQVKPSRMSHISQRIYNNKFKIIIKNALFKLSYNPRFCHISSLKSPWWNWIH